jgi:Tol biopolymer transport system component
MTKGDDIFIMPANGGEAQRLTFDYASIPSPPAWTRDGRWIVFSSTRNSIPTLWRIPASGGSPVQIPQVGVVTKGPAVSPRGDRLAYDQILGSSSIWSIEIAKIGKQDFRMQVTASKGSNQVSEFSPDGMRIAFQSDRSGTMEIWSCGRNGTNLVQLTKFGGAQSPGPPRWSPDSREIAFDSAFGEHSAIFLINAEGGLPRPLTKETSDNLNPSWSRDGKWIYFTSNSSGKWQIWKMPAGGGEPLQVTKQGGFVAFESAAGKFIYYAKTSSDLDIWRMQVDSGQESPVSPRIHLHQYTYWALIDNGIFFLSEEFSPHPVLRFFNLATASTKDLLALEKPVPWKSWISASADGKFVLYQQQDQVESNIMLLENFR